MEDEWWDRESDEYYGSISYEARDLCLCGDEHREQWWGLDTIEKRHHRVIKVRTRNQYGKIEQATWVILVNDEYMVDVTFCPDCGIRLR